MEMNSVGEPATDVFNAGYRGSRSGIIGEYDRPRAPEADQHSGTKMFKSFHLSGKLPRFLLKYGH